MFSQISTRLAHEASRSVLWSAIPATYVPLGDALEYTARQILFQNDTDEELWISLDGVRDGFFLRSGQDLVQDISTNQTYTRGLFLPVGGHIYVRQKGVPSLGSIYACVFYGED
jgi:hypothetical protein